MSVFDDVKQRVSLRDAISYLNLGKPAHTKGDEWRWSCPRCGGSDRTLCVTLDVGFGCWVGSSGKTPKHKGDCIALVAHIRGITQTEAAKELNEHFRCSSTKPEAEKPKAEGRRESANALSSLESSHPVIEMLGIDPDYLAGIGGGFDGERILIPLPPNDGRKMTLGIATRSDQAPLLLFSESVEATKVAPDDLRKLFRVVG